MVGKLTRQFLESGNFPWCLNQTFADARPGGKGGANSPYACYILRQSCLKIGVVLSLIVGALALVGFVNASLFGNQDLNVVLAITIFMVGVVSLASFLACILKTGIKDYKDDLTSFESCLLRVVGVFEEPDARPVHLMTVEEVKTQAQEILTRLAFSVLQYEREDGLGCTAAENSRTRFRNIFDLFIMYGVINRSGYAPYYETAKKKLEAGDQLTAQDQHWCSFDEALQILNLQDDELKRLVSEGEIRWFRDGESFKFRLEDVKRLKEEREAKQAASPTSPESGK